MDVKEGLAQFLMKRVARAMTEVQPGTELLTGTGRIPQQTKRTRQTVLANS